MPLRYASLADKRAVYPPNYKSDEAASPGMLTHDRFFISGMPGSDPATGKVPDDPAAQVDLALDRMQAVVKAAGLDMSQCGFRQSLPDVGDSRARDE